MEQIKKLIVAYEQWAAMQELPPEARVIQVDKVAAKVAAFYEKIRGVVDWSEEHLLRKTAIARILRRRFLMREGNQSFAESLVRDVVRGGYFPNNRIPEGKILLVDAVLKKYIFLIDSVPDAPLQGGRSMHEWLLAIAGCEIEALLDPPIREEALTEFMTEQMDRRIVFEKELSEQERENLVFIGVRQALFKLDEPVITYQLIKKYIPNWSDLDVEKDRDTLMTFAHDLPRWYESISQAFRHSLAEKFYWACEIIDTPYLILGDILTDVTEHKQAAEEKFEDPHWLEAFAAVKYKKRLKRQRRKAFRAAFYSTLSIFITKVLVAYALEVPFDTYITKQFSSRTLLLNILIPPALMLLIVLWGTKPPPRSNAAKVIDGVKKVVRGELPTYEIRLPRKRSLAIKAFVGFFYFVGSIATFTVIVYALSRLKFTLFSQAIFIFFISLIAFAGMKIRERSKELSVEESSPNFLQDLISFFTLPVVELGRWGTRQLLRIRVVQIVFDVLIELPILFFVEFIEQWRAFLKEKKEEIH